MIKISIPNLPDFCQNQCMNKRRSICLKVCSGWHNKNAWSVDYDYAQNLGDEALEFLAGFTQFFYHGRPDKMAVLKAVTAEMKTESYNRNNRAIRDIMNVGLESVPLRDDYIVEMINNRDITDK